MSGEKWRFSNSVEVPSVVGLTTAQARRLATKAGLVIAQADADGPPLGALTWPGEYVVTAQHPAPGARLWQWDSVIVQWTAVAGGDQAGDREPRRPVPPTATFHAEQDVSHEADQR